MSPSTHLKHRMNGDVYPRTPGLEKNKNMVPCDAQGREIGKGNGTTTAARSSTASALPTSAVTAVPQAAASPTNATTRASAAAKAPAPDAALQAAATAPAQPPDQVAADTERIAHEIGRADARPLDVRGSLGRIDELADDLPNSEHWIIDPKYIPDWLVLRKHEPQVFTIYRRRVRQRCDRTIVDLLDEALAKGAPTAGPKILSVCMANVKPEPVRWLWRDRIPRGKITDISGDPGLGKSQITASIAAVLTRGGRWPVDRSPSERGSALILSAEDGVADTIRPRLEAAGADLTRCHVIEAVRDGVTADGRELRRTFNLRRDLSELEALLEELADVALVVIDPVSAYLGGTDSHTNADVRGLLAPVADLAERFGVAVITVNHLNKGGAGPAIRRVNGSIAFVAAARAAWIVVADPDDKEKRLFLPSKNNLAKDRGGLAYRLEGHTLPGGIETCRVVWESDCVALTADQALAPPAPDRRTATDEAEDWLRDLLAGGPMKVSDVQREAEEAGVGEKPLRSARERLRIKPMKSGFGGGGWVWKLPVTLPSKMPSTPEDALSQREGIFDGKGHLREPAELTDAEDPL